VKSSEELRESRARLIEIADSERRRVERALHDGVLQDLVAMSVRLQLARQTAESDPKATLSLLEEIGNDVREALDRVRTVANDIYPTLLAARGIPDSLHAVTSSMAVPAEIDAEGLDRYDERIETAVYFCCRAALEAAARANTPGHVVVRLSGDDETVRCEVTIDGVSAHEISLQSQMAGERIDALGGTLVLEQIARDRVVLSAHVPLAQPRSAR
jgi:signal transduction histidine kinase